MTFIRKQRTLIFVALLSLGLLTACSSKSKEAGAKADSKEEPAPAIEVKTAPVIERRTNRSVEVVGSLVAEDEVTVSSQASGNLADITVDLGTAVRRGQIIARVADEYGVLRHLPA